MAMAHRSCKVLNTCVFMVSAINRFEGLGPTDAISQHAVHRQVDSQTEEQVRKLVPW
jgi:hypothetical protein